MGGRLIFAVVVVAVVFLWGAWAGQSWLLGWLGFTEDLALRGQWGDTFGALNALFAAAAFVGVLATLRMQSREIANQQDEIKRQNQQLEVADRERKVQRFEDTLFQLLRLLRELKQEVTFEHNGEIVRGHAALRGAAVSLFHYTQMLHEQADPGTIKSSIAGMYVDGVHRYAEDTLGPYFRIVYTLLRRISESEVLTPIERAQYGNLVRSQLSSPEISLIAANGLTQASNDFRKYIEEFRLLKYHPKSDYLGLLRQIYEPTAFAARD